jgi:predicted DNA-binding transcriptional regulator AlpA
MGRESDENHDDPLLLLPEVAELCRMSESTLRWLRHRGEGPSGFKMGRRLVFRRTAVEAWISERERAQQ